MVYGFVETHLRDMEQPPCNPDYVWEECNRMEGTRKGGGIGAFIRKSMEFQRIRKECDEHLWLKGKVAGEPTLLGVVYLWTGTGAKEENRKMLECISRDVSEVGEGSEIIIMGDMNAHIEDLDGYTDSTGSILLEMVEKHDLVLCNISQKCDGRITWETGSYHSTIDYVLMSHKIYSKLQIMKIDEESSKSLGSDHKRVKLSFTREVNVKTRQNELERTFCTDKQLEIVAKRIEEAISRQLYIDWSYESLTGLFALELDKVRSKRKGKQRHRPKSWWDKEVKEAIEKRQEASREHRYSKRSGQSEMEVKRKWDTFIARRREASSLINAKIKRKGIEWMSNVSKKDRNAAKKFWEHLNSLSQKTKAEQRFIHSHQGDQLEGDAAMRHIGAVMREKFQERGYVEGTRAEEDSCPTCDIMAFGQREWEKAERKVPSGTSIGPDGIPIKLVKNLGPKSKAKLREVVSTMITKGNIPNEWRLSRMSLIYKGKGAKTDVSNYRPITVTPVIYRLVMQIVKNRLEEWVECEGVLGELQNGFRKRRRLEDNIFSLTQCIEVAQKEDRQLWLAFLDIKGAYDNVSQRDLWDIVERFNLDEGLRELLKNIYKDNKAIITWEGNATGPIDIGRGLRQGCPLSPLLFMLYLRGLEDRLEKSGLGFDLSYSKQGQNIQQSLPGMMYADDIVLMASNRIDLQELMNICGREGEELGLEFSSEKSAVMTFNNSEAEGLKIQNITVEKVNKYKYLGVWISDDTEYLNEHEKYVTSKSNRNAAVMKNRALWNYNRYEVVREIWKGVMVPGLTFGNAVLCMKPEVQARLEVKQRGVGRLALGAHCKTPNQGVQGDMGWSSFEGREAASKIEFEDRLRQMDGEQWARKVFSYLYMRSVDTKWRKRTRKLRGKFLGYSGGTDQQISIKKKVKAT
ncbi:MAG: reverse transcriptase domain-containing protein, partial [Candidatus Midichloria sp.]|nr:reverse transcriptase domain-containing protein [Candidatus Midichloria sp.]